jgi:transcriptional regulator with AAA-type ATPase domain
MVEVLDRTLDAEASSPLARPSIRSEPHLLVALECDRPLSLSTRHRLGAGGTVVIGRGATRSARRTGDYRATELDVRVPDPRMSSVHARLEGAFGQWTLRDAGSKNGVRVNGEPVRDHILRGGDLVELGHTLFLYEETPHGAGPDDVDGAARQPVAPGFSTLVPALEETFSKLERLAKTSVPVLVLGETGTGKEVIARAVHAVSGRSGKFVGVNSGAIPESLLESELFGSTRGAFSGSVTDRPGLVRSADRGTLFLDEIGDLPLLSQAAFLRVLEEHRVRPVGGTDSLPVDVRLVSATNRDVEKLVREGKFREDLFSRVAGFRILLPPLRERRADLGLLVGALILRIAHDQASQVTLTVEAARALYAYRFPLNVRELENWLRTAFALAGTAPIRPEHLPEPVDLGDDSDDDPEPLTRRPLSTEQEQHRDEIVALLREHQGNVSAVARAAGKARNQVQRWLKRYSIDPNDFR